LNTARNRFGRRLLLRQLPQCPFCGSRSA
jgi:hypothetical protein